MALLGVLLLVSGAMFLFSRSIDKAVRIVKINRKLKGIEPCSRAARDLDQLASAIRLSSTEELIDDFRPRMTAPSPDQDASDAVRFYEANLKRSHAGNKIMESAELIGVAVVGIYALYVLITMALGVGPTTA